MMCTLVCVILVAISWVVLKPQGGGGGGGEGLKPPPPHTQVPGSKINAQSANGWVYIKKSRSKNQEPTCPTMTLMTS